ncbi:MAG: FAD-dependent oxidoreductase [Vulcanimicrobiota bacterium]
MKKLSIVVIGGVAAGASAAAKAARTNKEAEVIILEKGPHISIASCGLPYYISREVKDRGELIVRRPEDLEKKYGIKVKVNHEVLKIDRPSKKVLVRDLTRNKEMEIDYDKLIIATGARAFMPPIRGIESKNVFTLRDISDVDTIDNYINQCNPQKVVVLGGGYIGVEVADTLRKRGLTVSLVEMYPHVLPVFDEEIAGLIQEEMKKKHINVIVDDPVKELEADENGKVKCVVTKNDIKLDCQMVLANLGVKPNMNLAEDAGLEVGEFGITVDDYMRTSDTDIFAAGDVVQVKNLVTGNSTWSPLAGPANLQGKIAGANAAGENLKYRGVLRTSIVQFGEVVAARTGIWTKEAEDAGIDYFSVTIYFTSHVGYYPNSEKITVKALARKTNGQLLGAQVAGKKGVDKRIDVLATAITNKMNGEDLEHLDLAYSPQFSHPLDAVNVLGSVIQSKLEKIRV